LSVSSTAKDVSLASNLTSATYTVLSKASGITTFAFSTSASENPKLGATAAELFDFTLDEDDGQDATLTSITFREGNGTIDYATSLKNFKLVADGAVIATTSSMNGKYLTFKIANGFTLPKGDKTTFTVKADIVAGNMDETINFVLQYAMDTVVMGDTYNVPMTIAGASTTTYSEDISLSAGKVTLAKVTTLAAGDLVADRDNVFLGAFTITNNENSSLNLSTL
jgi:hypothetical protein